MLELYCVPIPKHSAMLLKMKVTADENAWVEEPVKVNVSVKMAGEASTVDCVYM